MPRQDEFALALRVELSIVEGRLAICEECGVLYETEREHVCDRAKE